MSFPWVSRSLYEEVLRQRDELKRERDRWVDMISLQNWKGQIHDSIPVSQVAQVSVEPASEPPQSTEEELAEEHRRDLAEMTSRARTRPSTLPAFMQRVMEKRLVQRAKAAVSQEPVKRPEVAARFEALKTDVLKSKSIH